MTSGSKGGAIQFTDLRLRIDAIEGGVRSHLVRPSDGLPLAEAEWHGSVASVLALASEILAGHGTDRVRLCQFGRDLGQCAFSGRVGDCLVAEAAKAPIRIRVSCEGDLSLVPWELTVLTGLGSANDGYMTLCGRLSLTREVLATKAPARPTPENPRVLVAWANPGSSRYPLLHFAEKEAASVMRALRSAECSSIQVEELPYASVSSLLRCLSDRRPDVLHFVGHGDLLPSGGVIVLDGGMPQTDALLYAEDLASAVVGAGTSLAVLSGCLTSGSQQAIGAKLASAGVPAVLAMSMQIQDAAAHQFARAMYSSLAEGTPLDEALFEGRCAIFGMGCDWAAPQLMLSGSEPVILSDHQLSTHKWRSSERKTNLSYDDRPFIGRSKERSDLRSKIRDHGQRLVSITGPGGMGKTRLSKQVAAELIDEFPDGVWFVDCETLIDSQDLVAGIATVLPFGTGAESTNALKECLTRRRILIVLDCFENSVAQGGLLEELLQHASGLSILITSRIVLGITREHEYPLPPMSVSSRGGETADGITLFAEAAGHALNGFEVTVKNRKLLGELCECLEGVPLAIVLAAGRLRHMSLPELIEQVRLQPVATLRRRAGGMDRHSNIESVVAGSFSLLPHAERQVLCKIGAFVGSFTLADAAFVCNAPESEQIEWLSELKDNSLVQIQRDDSTTRYKLLDTVRDYLSRLPLEGALANELADCRRRHAERYAGLSTEIGRLIAEGRWSAGTSAMMRDIGNIRIAISTANDLQRDDLIAAMVEGLARRFFEAGLLTDFRTLANAGYAAAERTGNPAIRIQLLGLEGALASRQGDEPRCEELWMERVELCRQAGDMKLCADALIDLAWQAFENQDPAKSRLRLIEALRLGRSAKDPIFIATVRVVQARIAFASSNLRLARLRNSQAEHLLPQCAETNGSLFVCQLLAISCRELGDLERSVGFTVQLLRLSVERNQVIHAGWALLELAPIYEQTDRLHLAARCYLGAMKVHAEYSTRHRVRATAALNQFKKKHQEDDVAATLTTLRSQSWQEVVEGLTYV